MTSDYAALHSTQGAVDGTDMEQPFNTFFGAALQTDVENGTIPRSCWTPWSAGSLTEMFRFDIFNHPPTGTTGATVTTPAHQARGGAVAEDGHRAAQERRRGPAAAGLRAPARSR